MSEVIGVSQGIPAPEDRWDAAQAPGSDVIAGLVYRSNLLGADRALANQGGGNTSAKETVVDQPGTARECCGSRARAPTWLRSPPRGSPGCGSTSCCCCAAASRCPTPRWWTTCCAARCRPISRDPSIETLLHAFIPAPHVDHTHPDAVIALTSNPGGRPLAETTFDDEVATADLLGLPVLAGPEEATALGNVLVQARAVGELDSLAQMRELVGCAMPIVRYEPSASQRSEETYEPFLAVTGLGTQRRDHATV